MNRGSNAGTTVGLPTYLTVTPLASNDKKKPGGVFCTVRAEPVLKSVGGLGVTFATFHALMFWLNALAALNMLFILVTAPVFHAPIGWLNTVATPNMLFMSATFDVFHAPIGWLNALAS